jgi:hypothetical protein
MKFLESQEILVLENQGITKVNNKFQEYVLSKYIITTLKHK